MRRSLLMLSGLLLVASGGVAQDAVEVDPDHYEVALENEHVRVLLINYGPGETSVMHFHPAGVSVFVTDIKVEFELPDETKMTLEGKAGETSWIPAGHHLPTNISDEPFTGYHIEIKGAEGSE
jgi:quercetin dioxygenase-like cupin family protein